MFDWKCKIIFIRHGSTIYTNQNRLYDLDDYPPINEKGKTEIEKIATWLKASNFNVDMIYTSSALRSIQSTRIVSKHLKKDFEIVDNLFERRAGIWGGLTFKQIGEKYPEMYEQYRKNPCSFWPEGGESKIDINNRVKQAISELVKKHYLKRLVIITHADVIQAAISTSIGIPSENQGKIYIPTGSATQINYSYEWASLVYSAFLPL